jgi:hypothetical protein
MVCNVTASNKGGRAGIEIDAEPGSDCASSFSDLKSPPPVPSVRNETQLSTNLPPVAHQRRVFAHKYGSTSAGKWPRVASRIPAIHDVTAEGLNLTLVGGQANLALQRTLHR